MFETKCLSIKMKKYVPKLLLILLMFSFVGFASFLVMPVHATTVPSGILYYVPITLTNSQSTAVSGGTQVSITMNWDNYQSYLDNPVDNYAFFNSAGNMLYSWLESGTANSATNALVWVKLDSAGIPASGGTETIYLGFYALSSNQLSASGYTGEYPTATGTYGQYDNGPNVFSNYWNFAGSTLPSDWQTYVGSAYTVNNGVTFSGASTAVIGTTAKYSINNFVESNFQVTSNLGGGMAYTVDSSGNAYTDSGNWLRINSVTAGRMCNGQFFDIGGWSGTASGGISSAVANGAYSTGNYVAGMAISSSGNPYYYINEAEVAAPTTYIPPQGNYYLELGTTAGQFTLNWVRPQVLPPNGNMPTSSFGSGVSLAVASVPAPSLSPSSSTTVGTSVSLSVTISGDSLTPTGTATFQVEIGSGSWTTIGSAVSLSSGSASTTDTPQISGSYQFQVIYSGDGNYNGDTSDASSITVNAGSATSFVVSGFQTPSLAGDTHSVTVTAYDAFGDVATSQCRHS